MITMKSGSPPTVAISTNVVASKVNADDRIVLYGAATSTNPNPLVLTWSANNQPTSFSTLLFGSTLTSPTTVLRKSVLTPGALYTFRLTAVDTDGVSGYAEVKLLVNAPPTSGHVTVTPTSGTALTTQFSFNAPQWTDDSDDLPLSYTFAYIVADLTVLNSSSISMVGGTVVGATV